MSSKGLVKALLVLVVLGAVTGLGYLGIRWNSERFARAQAQHVASAEIDEVFDNFSSELKANYQGREDFMKTASGLFIVEPITEVKLESHTGGWTGGTYRYHLVQESDNETGYTLDVKTSSSLWGKKIQDLTIQPVRFND